MVPLPVTLAFTVTLVVVAVVVEVGLAMRLEVTGDVGGAQHLPTDVTGHFALVSDHVGAQAVFGSEG